MGSRVHCMWINYNVQGGSADKICLPDDPDYNIPGSIDLSSSPYKSVAHGTEYETHYPARHLDDHNVPCAVCYVPSRATTIMVPAKSTCLSTWTREYYGYLATEYDIYHWSSYSCIDSNPEVVPGTGSNTNPSLFYPTVTDCNGLSCPPYVNNHVPSCVACTKWP